MTSRPRNRSRAEWEDALARHGIPEGKIAATASAVEFFAAMTTPDAGRAFEALLRLAATADSLEVQGSEWATAAGFEHDDDLARLRAAISAAASAGLKLVDPAAKPMAGSTAFTFSNELLNCLPRPPVLAAGEAARLDARTMEWIPILVAASLRRRRGEAGLHLGFLAADGYDQDRLLLDLARHVAAGKAPASVPYLDDGSTWAILRAELHADPEPRVVAMSGARLFHDPVDVVFDRGGDGPETKPDLLVPTGEAALLFPTFSSLRNVYIWPVPAGVLPPKAAEAIGAGIGPASFDVNWAEAELFARVPDLAGSGNARTILRVRPDPRRAGATLSVVRAAIAAGLPPARACELVAGRTPGAEDAPTPCADFDAGLLVCRAEAIDLLAVGAAPIRGLRVLAWGPPGGGKTSYALALAERLGGGRKAISISPARILARAWGATERLLRDAWARAEREGAPIVADEFGSLCGVREASSSGNAYLVRSLTDEMLRAMDAHPDVSLIATVNDATSIEPAALRRFTFVFEFGDKLSAVQERLAWRRLLRVEPPEAWRPIGAAVADFAIAVEQCRALARADADSYAEALQEALGARTGRRFGPPKNRLH